MSSASWSRRRSASRTPVSSAIRDFAVDCEISGIDVTPELCQALDRLEPCGQGNPAPVLSVRGATVLATSDVRCGTAARQGRAGHRTGDCRGDRVQQAGSPSGSPITSREAGSSTRVSASRSTASRDLCVCGPDSAISAAREANIARPARAAAVTSSAG